MGGDTVAQRGNRAFVADLAVQHSRRLRHFLAKRLPNLADVGDLAQEVYLRLLRVDRRDSIRNPEAYLFTVAGHVVHQHLIREANGPVTGADVGGLLDLAEDSLDHASTSHLDALQQLERLDEKLDQLPPRSRAAFVLHVRDGYTLEEIAQQFSVSRSMAKKYLSAAIRHCDLPSGRSQSRRQP